ncbi:ABC transporter ATP-binding protein/permease, partial [Gammaproteobacteria bacterium]|nr:ABC transporter ATP-binding protein/permease [Gammaproteobacteria bacterium]
LFRLQFLVILMAFTEVVGVASIGPFLSLAGDTNQLVGDSFLAEIFKFTGIENKSDFIFLAGLGVLMLLTIATIVSTFTVRYLLHFAQRLGANFAATLFTHYMSQSWLFHASGNSSKLMNNITIECNRVTVGIIYPIMVMNARIVLALAILTLLLSMNPVITLIGLIGFASIYILIFYFVRLKLAQNGLAVSQNQALRFKLMNEGFGGIKDTLLLGRSYSFNKQFKKASLELGYAMGSNSTLNEAPKYWVELVALGTMVSLVLYLLVVNNGNLALILPELGVFAMAAYKLMPAFQQVYGNLTYVKASGPALDNIKDDLLEWKNTRYELKEHSSEQHKLQFSIELKDLSFKYPNKEVTVLSNINMQINSKNIIGVVGESGSGKSTLIDIILGLISPSSGQILIDGVLLDSKNLRSWQNSIGYVPQTIFLADASIKDNVAFGLHKDDIDESKVIHAIKLANLEEHISAMPDGINSLVGEKGVQLSGGQRQRIAIARALYNDPDVIVFDEATSALDGLTEKVIMDSIYELSKIKTIILIAHRLNTVKNCDVIYLFEKGKLIDSGGFEDMKNRNSHFKLMADHS